MGLLSCGKCADCRLPCLFASIPPESWPASARLREFSQRTQLWDQEGVATSGYFICRGIVQLSQRTLEGQEHYIDFLGAGETAGVGALLAQGLHNIEAVAFEGSWLIELGRSELLELTRKHRELVQRITQVREAKRERQNRRLLLACYGNARKRLIWELLDLGTRFRQWEGQGLVIELGLSKRDLEKLVGAGHTRMTQITEDLESRGLVVFERRAITLLNPLQLSHMLGDLDEIRYWERRLRR